MECTLDSRDILRFRTHKEIAVFRSSNDAVKIDGGSAENEIFNSLAVERRSDRDQFIEVEHFLRPKTYHLRATPSSSYGAFTPSNPNTVGYTSAMYGARSVAIFLL